MPDPLLRTERLVLRPLTAELAESLLAGRSAPGLVNGRGFPRDDDRSVMAGVCASGADAAGTWLVERDGVLLGTLGAAGPVSPDGDQEIGYGLVAEAHGAGLGTEAVAAVCAVLERREGVRRLTAQVLPGNDASVRLLRRLGFVEVERSAAPQVLLARATPGRDAVRPRIAGRHVC